MLAYGIAEFGCLSAAGHTSALGLSVVTWLLLAVSAATLAVAVAATRIAHRCALELAPRDPTGDAEGPPGGDMAAAGRMLSGMFAFVILVQSVPILYYLRHC
jgi:hypothetical protein